MAYSPEEYEQLKALYKEEHRKRKAIQEQLRRSYLRQKAEWHLLQMQASLERLGVATDAGSEPGPDSPPPPTLSSDPPSGLPPKTLL